MTRLRSWALLALVLSACGGTSTASSSTAATTTTSTLPPATTTTAASTTTTTAPATTTTTLVEDTVPRECIDAIERYVVAIEDVVAAYDFERGSLEEFQTMTVGLIPAGTALVAELQGTTCLVTSGAFPPDAYSELLEFAQQEAPGAVTYLEVTHEMADMAVTGTCSTDIDTLQAYVDEEGTVSDLTRAERFHAFNLAGSINSWCGLQTAGAFLYSPAVQAFLEIG